MSLITRDPVVRSQSPRRSTPGPPARGNRQTRVLRAPAPTASAVPMHASAAPSGDHEAFPYCPRSVVTRVGTPPASEVIQISLTVLRSRSAVRVEVYATATPSGDIP